MTRFCFRLLPSSLCLSSECDWPKWYQLSRQRTAFSHHTLSLAGIVIDERKHIRYTHSHGVVEYLNRSSHICRFHFRIVPLPSPPSLPSSPPPSPHHVVGALCCGRTEMGRRQLRRTVTTKANTRARHIFASTPTLRLRCSIDTRHRNYDDSPITPDNNTHTRTLPF